MVGLRSCKLYDRPLLSRVFFSSLSSEQTASIGNGNVVYKMLSPAELRPWASVVPILDQWILEGNHINVGQLRNMVKVFRNYNRYSQALQLYEWMTQRSYLEKSSGNMAVHLDLISRVYGLQQAEKYFNTIPDSLKDFKVYGTLLNCYAFKKSLEKAEETMEKMKQLGYMTTLSYHTMLNLYSKTRNHDKLLKLVEEMEKTGVRYNRTTYYILLSAYAYFDIKAMENLLGYMETNPDLTLDWHLYIIAAKGYLNFGQNDKCLEMLKKTEQSVHEKTNGVAYEILLTMYANLAKKDHVYRIWDLYKTACRKVNNKMYHHMASSLVKLDDIEGAEKILTEWESKTTTSFDFWVVNVLVNGYSRKGDWKKAEDYVERLVGMGKQPPKSTWDCLATAYCKYEEMEKAVEAMKKAISCIDDDRWSLNQVTLIACVRYLENKGDMKVAKEFARLTEGLAESANNSTVGLAVNSSG
ncbi:putative tetratricopeptide-like helical domain superfamily [Helianthus annuus]|uniref:Putative tetratricopeptide-like helical domain-containing protein n=1 Tax=Helianthus annuus TaxID=4232 RepID=A0A251TM15_HELAN|nr:pentatricopeptide repeat-containing protein At2g20710, mitochondrial [Helianthus annuus]KAF5786099.1 putative tetratricopeptide-like helical domain superfamily [Helianthus annuus]KAJ0513234.1 putative tetratricopeptide-like helical domain superfamily [Helianthus annuus]KAJ0529671.1 putative tetratricopeptide-like helical domain superfamily [Helianthus annuus]KAJ0696535.1 putative tetratricopeptide-like helical domain superfamily [Helianthus annuus]KAJ0879216.1 putative tetratricopeptide-lik